MFVLIWATLLFSGRSSSAYTGASEWGRRSCQSFYYCITLPEGEITAEAGLCVVIPCSFTTDYRFKPQNMVWFKCEPTKQQCDDSDMIFHSDKNIKIQPEFRGRVSLLEPDVSQKNCSIIINDLKESDSGSYQLRVNGDWYGSADRVTYSTRATVSVKGLSQKPTVMVPPLTEGQQTTLTCTAPGLCSGSDPKITWMWRGAGEKNSPITGNITTNQGRTSTLTFNPSAEHHGTNLTCKVRFKWAVITKDTVTLNVTYVKELRIAGNLSVKEGETLNLSCTVEDFPSPLLIMWTKCSDRNIQNGTEINLQNNTLTDLQNSMATLSITNMTAEDSGQYTCTVKHLNKTMKENVNVTVIFVRNPVITGDTTVKKGDVLNLTCSVQSFPLSHITWTKFGSNTNLQSDFGSATLVIPDVSAEHSGQYICTAEYLDKNVTLYPQVTVTWFSKILNSSGCEAQSEVMTCVCMSEGFPLPTIKWPLLENYNVHSAVTTVSNTTVSSTVILTVKDHRNTAVECISSNESGEAKENLTTRMSEGKTEEDDQSKKLFRIVSRVETIIAFFIGILLATIIFFMAKKCHRIKHNSPVNLDGTLEMVTNQEDPLIYDGQAVEDDQTHGPQQAEYVAEKKTAPELNSESKDVEYANIDFSLLKRRSPMEAARKHESTETEYAEIKKAVIEEREDDGQEEGEMLEGKEEEAMIEENEETNHGGPEEEEGEDMAVYSNVKDIMGEM